MKTNRSTLLASSLLCLVTAAALFAENASAVPKLVQVLQLRQNHVYLGKLRVLLTPQAMRLDGLGKFRFTLISRAPKWQVTAFRPEDRISFTQSFDEFCDQGLFSNMVMPQRENTMQKGGAKLQLKVSGFPVEQIRTPSKMLKYLKNTNYAASQAAAFFHSAYKVPTEGHIPIEFELVLNGKDWMTNLSEKGQRRTVLETEKISLDNVPYTEFEIPRGSTQAKSMTRIIVGDTKKMKDTGIGDLFHF
ncbi:MAG: hypothetical protein IT342_21390 [Candidatus Melainabacteria bacterium]|nr:hypothetical protein [Candidatus Melainabacteria bacterium]